MQKKQALLRPKKEKPQLFDKRVPHVFKRTPIGTSKITLTLARFRKCNLQLQPSPSPIRQKYPIASSFGEYLLSCRPRSFLAAYLMIEFIIVSPSSISWCPLAKIECPWHSAYFGQKMIRFRKCVNYKYCASRNFSFLIFLLIFSNNG